MKKGAIIIISLAFLISCKEIKKSEEGTNKAAIAYLSFGEKITDQNVISKEEMAKKFNGLQDADTLNVKFNSTINEVCKAKGCWMKLDLGDDKESMVRFKDYGFFMPLNSDNKEVIVQGKAYITSISVDELKHYAKDAGKTEAEIEKITEPEYTYAFEADGVLMKE